MNSHVDRVVEVWERVEHVQSGALEDAEVLFGDVVEEHIQLALTHVE
jgi:hypothetical protein